MITCAAAALSLVLLTQFAPLAPTSPALLGEGRTSAPAVEGKPIEVAIGFYALDFARVTSSDESFDLTGYLEMSWPDPRLALTAEEKAKSHAWRRLDSARIWTPRIFFENAVEQPRLHAGPVIEVDPDGVVWSWAILSVKFSTPMQLERFPFDWQVLSARIGSFEDESVWKFRVKNELVLVGDDAFLTDWRIVKPAAWVDSHRYVSRQAAYSRFIYEVAVERRAIFYVWRVMIPLGLLAVVSWAAFWFDPVDLQPQVTTSMAAMIALVTFNFAVDFSLPKLAYLTLIDRHALIGLAFVLASIVGVTLIHTAVIHDRLPLARSMQRAMRRAYMPVYLLAVILNIATTFS